MSFLKYIEDKSNFKIKIKMDAYKENLYADLSALVIKPNDKISEAKKNIVNINEVSRILNELKYPFVDEFVMAIKTGNSKKIAKTYNSFRHWSEDIKSDLIDQIELIILRYQKNLFDKFLDSNQIDEAVDSCVDESQVILDEISQKVDLAIKNLPNWKKHLVHIEAIYPKNGWVINQAKIIIDNKYEIIAEKIVNKIEFSNLKNELMLPDITDLLNKLNKNSKYSNIVTLFMNRPIADRKYFETIKRDLSLGIKSVIPNNVSLLSTLVNDDNHTDVWKIKLEQRYIFEKLCEGDYREYSIIEDVAPVKWIERIPNEKQ